MSAMWVGSVPPPRDPWRRRGPAPVRGRNGSRYWLSGGLSMRVAPSLSVERSCRPACRGLVPWGLTASRECQARVPGRVPVRHALGRRVAPPEAGRHETLTPRAAAFQDEVLGACKCIESRVDSARNFVSQSAPLPVSAIQSGIFSLRNPRPAWAARDNVAFLPSCPGLSGASITAKLRQWRAAGPIS